MKGSLHTILVVLLVVLLTMSSFISVVTTAEKEEPSTSLKTSESNTIENVGTSFHIDSISAAAGFKNYYGMEDMELKLDYADPGSFWFGWDHETFNKVQNELTTITQPFISFVFSCSNIRTGSDRNTENTDGPNACCQECNGNSDLHPAGVG